MDSCEDARRLESHRRAASPGRTGLGHHDDEGKAEDEELNNSTNSSNPTSRRPALIYATLLRTKSEAASAVKHLLAQVNNDHANFPTEIVFRLHSDQGSEFMNDDLDSYCAEKGIHKTWTSGYDLDANSAESIVGTLKRRSRYLLSGCRLPTNWWGLATLAAAQLCMAYAGLEEYPRIPFGTRVMLVRDPAPRNAFLPRAESATCFGPSSSVSGGFWVYQRGLVKAKPTWLCRA